MLARAALVVLALAPLVAAETLHVPKDHATIQAAIDAAVEGDTILVSKGTYEERPVIDGRSGLLLRGLGHPKLVATGFDVGLTVGSSTGISVLGFDVEGAAVAGILVIDSTNVLVQRCRITGLTAPGWPVAAIQVAGGSQVHLDRNFAEQVVVGLRFFGEGGPEATDCTLTKNVVDEVWHSALELRGSGHHVERNVLRNADVGLFLEASDTTVLRNSVRDVMTGIEVFGGDGAHLERNVVRNAALYGVHVDAAATGTTLLHDTIKSCGSGAGLFVEASGASVSETRILKSTGAGAQITGSGCTLTDLRVAKSATDGVVLEGVGHVVTGLRVVGTGEMGVKVTGQDNELTDCRVSHASTVGFSIEGDGNDLSACISLNAGDYDVSKLGLECSYAPDCKFKKTFG